MYSDTYCDEHWDGCDKREGALDLCKYAHSDIFLRPKVYTCNYYDI